MVVFIHVPRYFKVLGKPLLKLVFLFGMPLGRINKRRKNHYCKKELKMILSLNNTIKIFLSQKKIYLLKYVLSHIFIKLLLGKKCFHPPLFAVPLFLSPSQCNNNLCKYVLKTYFKKYQQ
jgi:hypothetical protein